MYSYRYKDSRGFTAHAAVQLQRLHNNSTSNHRYDGDGQLLEDVSLNKTSKQLKSLVQETFPLVSTATTNDNVIIIIQHYVVILVYTRNLLYKHHIIISIN